MSEPVGDVTSESMELKLRRPGERRGRAEFRTRVARLALPGRPYTVLPGSQVLRFIVPSYVQEDPALARAHEALSAAKRR